ncbi:MAG: CpaF family protein [Firmicutes bacterium]|nr:CpaF family protein [Bacillota bacterium]
MQRNSDKEISILKLAQQVRERVGPAAKDEDVMNFCKDVCLAELAGKRCGLRSRRSGEIRRAVRLVYCTLRCELEILQDLADDPQVTEIMVNGPGAVFIERGSGIERSDVFFETPRQLEQVIQRLAAKVGREMNELNPIVDARLSDGSRINAVGANVAIGGPILTIRKFNKGRMTMEDLVAQGDISPEAAELLKLLVECRYNIFVSGGTSSGKTTFLNVLSDHIPPQERVIVIEDSAELQIRSHQNLVRLEAKGANAQGRGAVSIKDLIRASLRMRPDRIIVGEVRGAEVVDMLAAMSTGHDGSLSTGHANSAAGMIGRLETMFLSDTNFPIDAVRGQIAQSIDVFVHLARTQDGHRRVIEISEVRGVEGGEVRLAQLFRYTPGKGLETTGEKLKGTEKLRILGRQLPD